jgi:hypothetical protein
MTRTRASGPPRRRSARYAGYADPVSLDHDSCGAGRPIRRSHLGRSDRGSARPASRWHRFVNPVKDRWAGTRRTDLPISGIRIIVHRMPLTSAICANKSIRTLMNADERRWMRPKIRPPGPGCLAQTFARVARYGNGMEQERARPTRRWSLVLAALLVATVVSMVALAPSPRDAVRRRAKKRHHSEWSW